MICISNFREIHRNALSHSSSSIEQGLALPRKFLASAQRIDRDASELIDILLGNDCFPEFVRLVSMEDSIKGVELRAVAVPVEQEYKIIYTDDVMINELASEALASIAYTPQDQDFWLFPAPGRLQAQIINPLLIPTRNFGQYNLGIALKVKPVSRPPQVVDSAVQEQVEEPILFPE